MRHDDRRADKNMPRINEQIRVPKIRLIDEEGEMIGVITPAEGLDMAREVGLDLVEVSPNAEPPVCKILDFGKYKYQQQKKQAEARKKQTVVKVKEVKLRPGIDTNDYYLKLCGSGGGGYILGFTEDFEKAKQSLKDYKLEMVYRF